MKSNKDFNILNKGLYYYGTKYALLLGWVLSAVALIAVQLIEIRTINLNLTSGILVLLAIFIVMCQICFSYIFSHQIFINTDHIYSIGPWSISHSIMYDEIRYVALDEYGGTMLMKHKFGLGRIYIPLAIDVKMKIRNAVLNKLLIDA